jgi:hypothetical protein
LPYSPPPPPPPRGSGGRLAWRSGPRRGSTKEAFKVRPRMKARSATSTTPLPMSRPTLSKSIISCSASCRVAAGTG